MYRLLLVATLAVSFAALPAAVGRPEPSSCQAPAEAAGTYVDLDIDMPGAQSITLRAINERGDIVGHFLDVTGETHSFLLRQGETTLLAVPGAVSTLAHGINASGAVVGTYVDGLSEQHAFTWRREQFTLHTRAPSMRALSFRAINASGAIAGSYGEGAGEKAFVLRGARFEIVDVGRPWAFPLSINARGDLLLIAYRLPGPGRGSYFLVTGRSIQEIEGCGDLDGFLGGHLWSVTNQGHLVGRTGTPTFPEYAGYSGVQYSDQDVTVFNYPGAISTELVDMNSAGYAIGHAWGPTWWRAFLFVPHGR